MVKNIFILNGQFSVVKVLTLNGSRSFFDDLYSVDFTTGAGSYEFTTNDNENIKEGYYVMFYYQNEYKLFQIIEIEEEHDEGDILLTCYAENACLELLNSAARSFNGDMNCIAFFQYILNGTRWQIGKYSSSLVDNIQTIEVTKTTPIWTLIQEHIKTFNYEINPRVEYSNGHITGLFLDIYAEGELGDRTCKRFEYGRNVSGIIKKKDLYDWCTGIIIDCDCDVTQITLNKDGYTKGNGSDTILANNENKLYNNGRDFVYGVYEGDEIDGQEAVDNALKALKERATPHFDYEVTTSMTYEEYLDVHIGDTVYVIDHEYTPDLLLEARVGKLEISFSDRTKCRCTFTNYKEIVSRIDRVLTGNVQEIIDAYFPITTDKLVDGAVTKDKINVETYDVIIADSIGANKIVTEELIAKEIVAVNGRFENLSAEYAKIKDLEATNLIVSGKATIQDLQATNANITNLTALVAEIQTLVGGHLTMDNIQSLVLTADKVTIADALIKDAMIENVSASKINTGIINTNNVVIQSEDGNMILSGTTQQFKDDNGNVRIQIGKDTSGNFTFILYDETGTGILLDQTGIKASAIGNGLIVNDMVADNANISGGKLDISSVITQINNNENTLIASKIKFNDTAQTLDVAFNQLKTKVDTIENITVDGNLSSVIEQVSTNTTNIGIAQGQISSLISNTTITKQDGTITQLKDEYMSTQQAVDGITTKVGYLETNYEEVISEQSVIKQEADKISWLVASGTASSNMTLTDDALRVISNNIDLTGKVTFNCLDVLAQKTITDTYDRVSEWASGSISESTTINGGLIESNTILAKHLALGDFNNYSQLVKGKDLVSTFGVATWAAQYSNWETTSENFPFTVDRTQNPFVPGDEVYISFTLYSEVAKTMSIGIHFYDESLQWLGAAYGSISVNLGNNFYQTTIKIPNDDAVTSGVYTQILLNTGNTPISISDAIIKRRITGSMIVDGSITADKIQGKELIGVTLRNDSNTFSVDANGNIIGANVSGDSFVGDMLSIDGIVSADTIICNKIDNPKYPATLEGTTDIYVNSSDGSDDVEIGDEKAFATLQGAINAIPKFMNGKNIRIIILNDLTENVDINYFSSGRIYIYFNGCSLNGFIKVYGCSSPVYIYGGVPWAETQSRGIIHPNTGVSFGGRTVSFGVEASNYVAIYSMQIYGADNLVGTNTDKVCVGSQAGGNVYCSDVQIVNTVIGFRSNNTGRIQMESSSGMASKYGFQAHTGGIIGLHNDTQAGGVTAATNKDSGGQIWYNSPTFASGSATNNSSTSTVPSTTQVLTIKSNYGDTYRSTVYNNWKKDGTVRQGNWGYGNCTGCWFFGTAFAEVRGKTISKVTITISRQSGGQYAAVGLVVKAHNHASRPSGAPTMGTTAGTLSLATGSSGTLTITDSTILNGISNGTIKGFGIQSAYNSSNYAVCNGSVTVKIYYTE